MAAFDGQSMGRATSGVAQGCPAFGLMFVVLAEPILRRIAEQLKRDRAGVIRACADDMAVALRDSRYLKKIAEMYKEAGTVSGLILKLAKCKIVIAKPDPCRH